MAPPWPSTVRPINRRIANEDYYRAVVAAGRAPSAHDTQPWRWQVTGGALDLFVVHQRMSRFPDPDGRLATISCGAALHHARLTLAARGWWVTVARRPVPGDPTHLARLLTAGKAPVSPDTAGLAGSITLPRTDQRPVTGNPVEPATLRAVCAAIEAQDVRVGVLTPAQILELTAVVADAGNGRPAGAWWHAAPALWPGTESTVGMPGPRLPIAPGTDDESAIFAVLHGPRDQDVDWLRAGEALSAGSLVASGLGLSLVPLGAPIEQAAAEAVRRAVPELGHPYLIVRLGRPATETVVPHASQPKTTKTIDLLSLVDEPD
jgi:nitroreductase